MQLQAAGRCQLGNLEIAGEPLYDKSALSFAPTGSTERRLTRQQQVMARGRTSKTAFDLDRFVPYLLNRVGVRIAMEFAREIRPRRVKYSSWRVLFTLRHLGPLQIIDLASLANFEISTLSRVIVSLERSDLVERINGEAGARNRRIALTRRGEKLVKHLTPMMLKHEVAALSGFSAAQHKQLIALLTKLHRNLDRYYARIGR